MTEYMTRRAFLGAAGMTAAAYGMGCSPRKEAETPETAASTTLPIKGSWFEFQHHNEAEGIYWNPQCKAFTCEQWGDKIKEMADCGLEYIVLMETALYFKAFYKTDIFPPFEIDCADPIEAILAAGDTCNVKIFMGGGFYGDWMSPDIITDPEARTRRLKAIEELVGIYGSHKSFYGWYWPNEAYINKHFSERFIEYVNECSALARSLQPMTKTLIAPYGTRVAVPDDGYVRQLENLDVDIIAYQDEVGVRKSTPLETPSFYEGLRKAHDKVPNVAIWADMEIFEFEGDVYKSALLPAKFGRVTQQIEAISPFVDTILVYQYLGMMNKPGSTCFAGHPDSVTLYNDYRAWVDTNHPGTTGKTGA